MGHHSGNGTTRYRRIIRIGRMVMTANHRIMYFSSQFPTLRFPKIGVFSLERVPALRGTGC